MANGRTIHMREHGESKKSSLRNVVLGELLFSINVV
jgi:hypothetical protein